MRRWASELLELSFFSDSLGSSVMADCSSGSTRRLREPPGVVLLLLLLLRGGSAQLPLLLLLLLLLPAVVLLQLRLLWLENVGETPPASAGLARGTPLSPLGEQSKLVLSVLQLVQALPHTQLTPASEGAALGWITMC